MELAHKSHELGSFPEADEAKNVYQDVSTASLKQRLQYLRMAGLCAGSPACKEQDIQLWQYLMENDSEAAQLDHYAGFKLAEYLTPRKHKLI